MVADDDQKVYVWDDTDDQLVEYPGATNRTLPRTGLTLIEWESLVVADDKLFVLATDSATRKWVAWDFPARTRSATDDVNAGTGLSEADGATFRDNRLWQLLDDTLYAYSLSDAQSIERFPNGDFQLHVDNADVHGMTIDGDDLFTVDDTGLNILGYNSSGNRNSLLDRALDNDNSDPGAIASDDTYFYVTDAEDDQVYRYVRVQTTITNPGIRRMVVWDDRLWGISVDGQLYYTYDFADGWTVDAKVPAFSVPVTDMFVYRNAVADPVIHVMTEEGLWIHDVENGRFEQSEVRFPRSERNGLGSTIWRGEAYIPVGLSVYRFGNAVLSLVGPDRDQGVPWDGESQIVKMAGSHNFLLAAVENLESPDAPTGTSHILGWDTVGWQAIWSPEDQRLLKDILVTTAYSRYSMWFGYDDRVAYINLPEDIINPNRLNPNREYDDTAYTITPWFNADEAETEKVALAIKAETSHMSATETIKIEYGLDDSEIWTELATINTNGQHVFPCPVRSIRWG